MALFADSTIDFSVTTPVIRMNDRIRRGGRWILWPVYVRRVVAPLPKERVLNLFQRTILALMRSGIRRVMELAEKTAFEAQLVAFIVAELQSQYLLTSLGEPTLKGLAALEASEQEPEDELRVGHVATNAFDGVLFPRFMVGDLPVTTTELDARGYLSLLSGSVGSPWRDAAFVVMPGEHDRIAPSQPTHAEILAAARQHRRRRIMDEIHDDHDVPRLAQVSFVDNQPELYLLAVRVGATEGDVGWTVDDPFGAGTSVEWRERIEKRMDVSPPLRKWLAKVVGLDTETLNITQLSEKAKWAVEEELTLSIRSHPRTYDSLVTMQRCIEESLQAPDFVDKAGTAIQKAHIVVEELFLDLVRRYFRPDALLSWSSGIADGDHSQTRSLAEAVGFEFWSPAIASPKLRREIQAAEQERRPTFRHCVILGLLAARHHEDHPLRATARRDPRFLHRISELADQRNPASHGKDPLDRRARVDPRVFLATARATAYDAVRWILFPNPAPVTTT